MLSLEEVEELCQSQEGFLALTRLWQLQEMVAHRSFSREQLAEAASLSVNWVTQILSGALLKEHPNSFTEKLDALDAAVDRLSQRRGMLCACPESTSAYIRDILSMTDVTREAFQIARAA
jgi:hypothetical protein